MMFTWPSIAAIQLFFPLLSFKEIGGMGKILCQEWICSLYHISFPLLSRLLISEVQLCLVRACLTRSSSFLPPKSLVTFWLAEHLHSLLSIRFSTSQVGKGEQHVGWKREQVMGQVKLCEISLSGLHCTKSKTPSSKCMKHQSKYFQLSPPEKGHHQILFHH